LGTKSIQPPSTDGEFTGGMTTAHQVEGHIDRIRPVARVPAG